MRTFLVLKRLPQNFGISENRTNDFWSNKTEEALEGIRGLGYLQKA